MNIEINRNIRKRRAIVAGGLLIVTLALLGAACGGGEDADPEPDATEPAATATRRAASPTPGATEAVPTATPPAAIDTPEAPPPASTQPSGPATVTAPPPAPTSTTPPPPPPPPPPPAGQTITVLGQGGSYVPAGLNAAANVPLTVVFNNVDEGIAHDIKFSRDGVTAADSEIIIGPAQTSVTFTPTAGSYKIVCTVHPRTMAGTLTVQ